MFCVGFATRFLVFEGSPCLALGICDDMLSSSVGAECKQMQQLMWLPGYHPLKASRGEAFTFSFPITCSRIHGFM